jgi:ferredoxin
MRLVIDYKRCRKAAQCSYLHPELFQADQTGAPVVLVEQPGEELREAAEEAVELCPNGAISFGEDE